ncbi:MAG: ABC transporter substrate-binding protein [Gammaproteobacteria bacterium]|nr:ABC transporter substrate-binding protein [Gammaproteobacteria bacterium]
MFVLRLILIAWCFIPLAHGTDPVRVGVLKFGTVNWELDSLKHFALDRAHGVSVEVVALASKNATAVALQGGAADIIVTDWIWVSRQRSAGRRYRFFPYSLAVGSVMVRPAAGIDHIGDLAGRRLGVAGGPVDKSWLTLRALGVQELGYDLADKVQVSFVAPPLLNQLLLRGELDAGLNFWHYSARLKAAGMRRLIAVPRMLSKLGVERPVPLLGWVFDEDWARQNAAALSGFLTASYAAKRRLDEDDTAWIRLQSRMKVADDAARDALRDAYRAGIPRTFGEDEVAAAKKTFAVLAEFGGAKLTGAATALDEGTFWRDFELPVWPR